MPLPTPNLDDRSFQKLVEDARRVIQQSSPSWTDLSPGDPGTVLLEAFAYLTDTMLYRLNRIPEKAYIEFLRLSGIQLIPPAAASVVLRFSRSQPGNTPITIPRGTRVKAKRTDGGKDPIVFATIDAVTIGPNDTQVDVTGYNFEIINAELVGNGNGLPGLVEHVSHPPIVFPAKGADLVVGIEATPNEINDQIPAIEYGGKSYRIWREVQHFASLGNDRFVYLVDRLDGTIVFAPSARMTEDGGGIEEVPHALAEVPANGREIRVWYRCGGGSEGNVDAGVLTELGDPVAGVKVTNPEPATGGRAAETLANALVRGPQEVHTLDRIITARDFEFMALKTRGDAARAKAVTRRELWAHALPGEVEVMLVPELPDNQRGAGQVTEDALRAHQTETARTNIKRILDDRRPLGTDCLVNWTRYKTVNVTARIVVRREEDPAAVAQRVARRLYLSICPLPTAYNPSGWQFGQALRASHIYDIALTEPGVLWADQVKMSVNSVPDKAVSGLAADLHQPDTWYAGSGEGFYRSLNDGEGWELMSNFTGETVDSIVSHPDLPGWVAMVGQTGDGKSRIHVSPDLGETWLEPAVELAFRANDMAWNLLFHEPVLLVATHSGLYQLTIGKQVSPVPVLVEPQNQTLGFYSIAVTRDVRGMVNVAVAGENTGGVYLSNEGGGSNSFRNTGLRGKDVRILAIQVDGTRSFLWAGTAAAGPDDNGEGCFRWELRGADNPPEGWKPLSKNWGGGSCRGLAFLGSRAMAASFRGGVLHAELNQLDNGWQTPDVRCGLPLRDPGRFHPVDAVAANPGGTIVMAGGIEGVYRSLDNGEKYLVASERDFADKVTLPPTWLFCSGKHELQVVSEDEAKRD
ncbi:MAG TPA: baseplate J/gp47 family protein [Anaerolineaceae bacterium]